jgi:hypothetical protein
MINNKSTRDSSLHTVACSGTKETVDIILYSEKKKGKRGDKNKI